jgi:hypothetical protein
MKSIRKINQGNLSVTNMWTSRLGLTHQRKPASNSDSSNGNPISLLQAQVTPLGRKIPRRQSQRSWIVKAHPRIPHLYLKRSILTRKKRFFSQ